MGTVIFVNKTAPPTRDGIVRTESSNLLAVLDQLNSDTLSDGRVGLLGLDTDLLEDDTLGVGRTTEGRGLESGTQGTLLIGKVGPFLVLSVCSQLSRSVKTTGFASSHFCFVSSVTGRNRIEHDGVVMDVIVLRGYLPIDLWYRDNGW